MLKVVAEALRAAEANTAPREQAGVQQGAPDPVQLFDYRFRQLIASNLAQAAIIASESPLGPTEMVDLYARIFVELFSISEVERAK